MTDSITSQAVTGSGHDDHAHPTEKQYWIVFVILGLITAVEIAWSEVDKFEGAALVVPLILMMVVKFVLIAAAFMHLFFDGKARHGKLFAYCFGAAMVLAVFVFVVVMAAFEFQI